MTVGGISSVISLSGKYVLGIFRFETPGGIFVNDAQLCRSIKSRYIVLYGRSRGSLVTLRDRCASLLGEGLEPALTGMVPRMVRDVLPNVLDC